MRNHSYLAATLVGVAALLVSPLTAFAAASVSVQNLSPGSSTYPHTLVTFGLQATGFSVPTSYKVSDSFANSTITANDLSGSGQFTWQPTDSDIGTHVLTLTASDTSNNTASTQVSITVKPMPTLSIQSLSPGDTVNPGTQVSFTVVPNGFVDTPKYIVGDHYNNGSSIGNKNINTSGQFTWTPDATQDGSHDITIYATDSGGHSAQISQTIQVGPGKSLTIGGISPGTSINPGQQLTFDTIANQYSPTSFSVTDSFPGSTVTNSSINTSGHFSWSPSAGDVGTHTLTVRGQVGAYGDSATTSLTVVVLGPGGSAATTTTSSTSNTSAASSASSNAASSSSTTADSNAIDVLKTELAAVQAKIASQLNSAASAGSSGFTFTSYLGQGSQGTEVTQLQTVLAQQGFFTQTPTGYFGPVTAAAVAAFQSAHGIESVGFVGPSTRAALNALGSTASSSGSSSAGASSASAGASATAANSSAYKSSAYVFQNPISTVSTGTDVIELQIRLASLGFLGEWPTGTFDTATEAAVKAFQSAHGIDAVGFVGPSTRAALNQ